MAYLVAYNGLLLIGWAYILYVALTTWASEGRAAVYGSVEQLLLVCQSAAVLEIFHVVTGLVRSPLAATGLQVFSRVALAWVVCFPFPDVQTAEFTFFTLPSGATVGLSAATMIVAWACSEIIRYSFYLSKEATGSTPSLLTWLRYSGFIVLYPLGVASEITCCLMALPTLYQREYNVWPRLVLAMPNGVNFSFDMYFVYIICLCLYFPGFPYLYFYMLKQRGRALSPKSKSA